MEELLRYRGENSQHEGLFEEMKPLLVKYNEYLLEVEDKLTPDDLEHPARMTLRGRFATQARRVHRLSTHQVAEKMGVKRILIMAYEGGIIPTRDLPEGFSEKLNELLKR